MSPTKKPVFVPVIKFDVETPADKLAVAAVHKIHADLHESMVTERNLKQTIGISEIGTDCMRCLARKVALLEPKVQSSSWKAHVGTMMHAYLEQYFGERYRVGDPWEIDPQEQQVATDADPVYWMERKLLIRDFGSWVLEGSCDMFIEGATFGLVDDWKTKSTAGLVDAAKGHVSSVYYIQMMTYGFGWAQLGKKVTHVVMYSLPRDGELDEARPVLMRYDEQVVIDRLALIENLSAAADIVGWQAVIDAQEQAGHCFDCQRYDAAQSGSFISDLTGGK